MDALARPALTPASGVPRIRHRCRGWSPAQRLAFFAEGGEGRSEYPADVCNQQLKMLAEKAAKRADAKPGDETKTSGLSPVQLHSLCVRLDLLTPSEPWATDLRVKIEAGHIEFKTDIAKELDRKAEFPPGGKVATLMRRCCRCGGKRWFPPQYLHTGAKRPVCAECAEHDRAPVDERDRRKSSGGDRDIRTTAWGVGANGYEAVELVEEMPAVPESQPSLTAIAVAALEQRGAVLEEMSMETEDEKVLAWQLKRHAEGKPTSLYKPDSNFKIP